MKKYFFIPALAVTLFISTEGCSLFKSPQQAAIKSEGVIVVTVDLAMKAWGAYVIKRQTDGLTTEQATALQSEIDKVHEAYDKYKLAQDVAQAALDVWVSNTTTNSIDLTAVNLAVTNAETALLSLINQFLIK